MPAYPHIINVSLLDLGMSQTRYARQINPASAWGDNSQRIPNTVMSFYLTHQANLWQKALALLLDTYPVISTSVTLEAKLPKVLPIQLSSFTNIWNNINSALKTRKFYQALTESIANRSLGLYFKKKQECTMQKASPKLGLYSRLSFNSINPD